MSIYDKSHLVSTVLQDTDGQFIGLSVAEDLAFALENDVTALDEMKIVFINGLKSWTFSLYCRSVLRICQVDKSSE